VLLDVDLQADYRNKPRVLRNVSFVMQPGEVLGLVGESGSGKSTIALALLNLLKCKNGRASGRVVFQGRDLLRESEREMLRVRGKEIGLIMQSPLASLNPALRIGTQLSEAWRAHARGRTGEQDQAVSRALARAGLPDDREFLRRYPSQISVGQAQRVLIAMAVTHSPALVIADEPTSALDVVTQREVLTMLRSLNRDLGTSVLYISHDLQSVVSFCHRIAILLNGEIVECGETARVLCQPRHPYTKQLLECAPWLHPTPPSRLEETSQELPSRAQGEWAFVPASPGEVALGLKSTVTPPISP
jgi:ABC-type dipeptide/oligopeptide/nickel transport system ATPase component